MTSRRPPDPRRAGGASRKPATAARRPPAARRTGASRPAPRGAERLRTERATATTDATSERVPAPTVTLRGLGLFLVLLVAFIVLAPTLRHAVEQQEELREVNARVEQARARNAELAAQLERWQDPIFVQAQARDRLGYVMPGESSYRVVDPELVVDEEAEAAADLAAVAGLEDAPWYVNVWDSLQVAGEAAPGEEPEGKAP